MSFAACHLAACHLACSVPNEVLLFGSVCRRDAQPHDIAIRDKCEHACNCMQLGVIHPTASVQACATAEGQSPCCFPSACLHAWCVSSDCLPRDYLAAPGCLSPGCFCVSPAKPVSILLPSWLSASLLCVNYMPSHRLAAYRGCFPPVCL